MILILFFLIVDKEFFKKTIKSWGGELIEPEYTKCISTTELVEQINYAGTTPDLRRKSLKKLIELKPMLKMLEAHNGLTALIVEKTNYKD